ncbi:hypothetical protein [Brucella anthropi]|uniref:hypothetical protein n=1 Tax=Brucella anthropi TaxID=529 RepID=UPI0007751D44|nr:hypothetical protein [Brucella anthropi]KXO72947.1 hypothetical protein AYJ56_17290 [Brucella anthropi]
MKTNLQDFTKRYIAVWNEADADKRRSGIEAFWAADGSHFTPTRVFSGHDELEERVEEAFNEFVRDKGFGFRLHGDPSGHHGIVKYLWEMVDPGSSAIIALGSTVLRLDQSDRIISEHQFVESLSAQA